MGRWVLVGGFRVGEFWMVGYFLGGSVDFGWVGRFWVGFERVCRGIFWWVGFEWVGVGSSWYSHGTRRAPQRGPTSSERAVNGQA